MPCLGISPKASSSPAPANSVAGIVVCALAAAIKIEAIPADRQRLKTLHRRLKDIVILFCVIENNNNGLRYIERLLQET
jgi:hypothetical protein